MQVTKSVSPTVLLFEDELILREMMGVILSGEGINFRSYEHPIIELAEPHDCDAPDAPCKEVREVKVIISDVMMPVVDGITFYEHLIMSDCRLKDALLILMSANDHRKQLHNTPSLKHVLYLDKPFVVKELRQILNQHLAH